MKSKARTFLKKTGLGFKIIDEFMFNYKDRHYRNMKYYASKTGKIIFKRYIL